MYIIIHNINIYSIYIYIHLFYINCMRILDQFATKETAYQESDCFSASSHMDVSKPKP